LESAERTLEKIQEFIRNILDVISDNKSTKTNEEVTRIVESTRRDFEEAMDDDLNISKALASIFDFMTRVNKMIARAELSSKDAQLVYDFMLKIDNVLGLKLNELKPREKIKEEMEIKNDDIIKTLLENLNEENIKKLIMIRNYLRNTKKFELADSIRSELSKRGILLSDTKEGTKWFRSGE